MIGLGVVLEAQENASSTSNSKKTQVIDKAALIKPSPPPCYPVPPSTPPLTTPQIFPGPLFPAANFLDACFLCRKKLLPGNDIYMYKGDRAFCSEECRHRQILTDEEEMVRELGQLFMGPH
ncbi:hypothetical protein Nepgr_031150 [Nepenthes gracilis]|uniref:FLZ-type domain-containing protein n=1 Tax=Nepenthes gracilis TaxID=150966 RepID=A0AAD3Y4J3_NEPGR|nr:hypothetical protein Nepgr_031150 [Nepenthes gracilis]